jgi:prevent-host-death family protein
MKGAIAEAAIRAAAVKLGFYVLHPLIEGRRYDLVIDTGPQLLRVQCKWAPLKDRVIVAHLGTCRHTPHGYVRSKYAADEIDGFGVYCQELDRCFWLPLHEFAGKGHVHLRLSPTRNRQRAWLIWADEYDFGAIAQLGERRRGTAEVVGSSPTSSIASSASIETVGAHEFRERLGWYLEMVKAGQRLLLTRHSKPLARLEPVDAEPAALAGLTDAPLRPVRDVA